MCAEQLNEYWKCHCACSCVFRYSNSYTFSDDFRMEELTARIFGERWFSLIQMCRRTELEKKNGCFCGAKILLSNKLSIFFQHKLTFSAKIEFFSKNWLLHWRTFSKKRLIQQKMTPSAKIASPTKIDFYFWFSIDFSLILFYRLSCWCASSHSLSWSVTYRWSKAFRNCST